MTNNEPSDTRQSIVEYMTPVMNSVTENATVQHILKISQQETADVGQVYTIVTFDLAVAKKAYVIVWQNQKDYGKIIISQNKRCRFEVV